MAKYQVCLYVNTVTANYITIEADSEELAEQNAMNIWYEDDRAFSSKLRDQTVDEITTNLE